MYRSPRHSVIPETPVLSLHIGLAPPCYHSHQGSDPFTSCHQLLHPAPFSPLPGLCYVMRFVPMLLSFSYLLGFKELVAPKPQGSQGPHQV